MKKLLSCMFILIFTLGIGTTCFGYTRTVDDLEEKLKCFGYGEINFEEYTFVPSTSFINTYDSLNSSLNTKNYYIVIYKYWDSERGKYDNSKFYFVSQPQLNFYKEKSYFYISGLYSNTVRLVDTSNKTLSFCKNLSVKTLFPDSFFIASGDVSEEEFNDINYQINSINNFLVYSEADILLGNTIIWDAYKASITEFSYDNIDYKGSINYLDSTNAASITYTSGFEENTYYDLFFEEYRLDNTLETGITEYPTLTIDLGDVTTSDTSVSLDFNSFNLSSMNIYRLCVGINNDEQGIKNTILLSTDWLCFNSNTLINYYVFAQRNYVILLNKVEFGTDYPEMPDGSDFENPDDTPLVYIYAGNCLGGYVENTDTVYLNIKRKNNTIVMSDYYFIIDVFDNDAYMNDGIYKQVDSFVISGDTGIWNAAIDDEGLVFLINFSDFYTFINTSYFYRIRLHSETTGFIDSTDTFWFNSSWYVEKNNIEKFLDGLIGIFVPSSGFFSSYFNDLNNWFSERLGMLYFPFDFIISFFNRIYTSEFNEPTIVIPAMQIPLFEEYGNIYDGTTFNFNEFIAQHETFKYIYNLYLVAVDGIIIWGLIRLLLKKYEEVTTNGN